MKNIKLIITGALSGAANGFFGAGGGLFLVPLFIKWIKLPEKQAFATSVAVIFPLSAISFFIYLYKGHIDVMFAMPFLLGGFFGGIISGKVFQKVPVKILKRVFGAMLIFCGVRMVFAI